MFERFTSAARDVVVRAQEHSRRLRHGYVGTEHLLLSMLEHGGGAARLLNAAGVTTDGVVAAIVRMCDDPPGLLGAQDAAALRAFGIDLDEVRARIEENFGPVPLEPPPEVPRRWFGRRRRRLGGHLPFSRRAKKVLELSLREALRLKHRDIAPEHILLGLLREGDGLAAGVLAGAGVDFADLRRRTEAAFRKAA